MIPREILKKIRPIGPRTNGHLNAFRSSTQTMAKLCWISCPMPNRDDLDLAMRFVHRKIDRVRPTTNVGFVALAPHFQKPKRLQGNRRNHSVYGKYKPDSKPFRLVLVPSDRFPEFECSFGIVNDAKAHFLYLSSISSRNCPQGTPRPGFLSASSARRSSSAICSGVNSSSSHSLRICSAISRRSRAGKRRSCSIISVALMPPSYRTAIARPSSVCSAFYPHSPLV